MQPRVSKSLDMLDRAGWTIIVAILSATITVLTSDGIDFYPDAVKFVLIAGLGTVIKVVIGQNTGTDDTGSLIGQPVIEPPPTDSGGNP